MYVQYSSEMTVFRFYILDCQIMPNTEFSMLLSLFFAQFYDTR